MNLTDIDILEGNVDTDEETYYLTLQHAINAGEAWQLQGHYGRIMMAALEEGFCLLGHAPAFDAYGGRIPSRTEACPRSPAVTPLAPAAAARNS